jgi:hypothetical protein
MRAKVTLVLVGGLTLGLTLYAQNTNITGNLCAGSADCTGTPPDDITARDIFEPFFRIDDTGADTGSWGITRAGGLGFQVRDFVGVTSPFTIEDATPTNTLYLEGTGRVGIGTSLPAGELHVRSTSANTDLYVERVGTGPAAALLSAQSDLVAFGTISNDPFAIATNNTTRMFITTGGNIGINTTSPSASLHVVGSLNVTGTKNFVEDHPTDPSKEIVYAAMEGGEAGTYVRGTAELINGKVVIDLPDHFGLVTAEKGLTVQLTPRGEWLQAFVVSVSPQKLVLGEAKRKNGKLDYIVQGVRRTQAGFEPIRNKLVAK